MVKGISRQVIVVHAPGEELFEQAIFILRDKAVGQGITDERLMQEAKQALRGDGQGPARASGPMWACGGAAVTALIWLISSLL